MLPCPWLMRFTGPGVYPGTLKNAWRYMDRDFFSSREVGRESNCLKETFKRLLVPFKKRDSADLTDLLYLQLAGCIWFSGILSRDIVYSAHTASSHCRGYLIGGDVLCPCFLELIHTKMGFFFSLTVKGLSMGVGQMEASVMEGNQQDELGFVWALGWRPKEVALEREVCWWPTVWELENSLMSSWINFWTKKSRIILSGSCH